MSRAFVKENDGPEPVLDRPVSSAPNYVTPRGLVLLREALARADASDDERERRYFADRIASAIVVEPSSSTRGIVEFGATIVARDARGARLVVRIVGEDEADPLHGTISWESPIARAFTDHRVGDRVTVARPAGPMLYTIEEIRYDEG
ncbi:MAG: GreA/GreB family elongation factor [bacterium]|nr:GreA/GreB family elongation factor [bacterium]